MLPYGIYETTFGSDAIFAKILWLIETVLRFGTTATLG
jgi:hypothetical protein